MGLKIIKTSRYVPPKIVTNDEFAKIMDTSDEWIRSRTGIETRRFAEDEDTSDLALKAVEKFRDEDLSNVDVVLVATFTPDLITPSIASMIQKELNIKNDSIAFDFNMACSGFVAGLKVMDSLLDTGKRGILVGAETISKVLDMEDRTTSILFGDGAGAALVEKNEEKSFFDIGSSGDFESLHALGRVNNPDRDVALRMEGKAVFRFATNIMVESVFKVLEKANLEYEDIDYYVFHQANKRIIEHVRKKLGLDENKFYMNLQNYGNTSAASIPIALDEMNEKGYFRENMKIVLSGFGGGLSWASTVITW